MEGGVYFKGARQLEAATHRVNSLDHLEGAHIARSQHAGFHPQWEVLGGQPNPLTRAEAGGWPPEPVSLALVPLGGLQESLSELFRGPSTPSHEL